MGNGVALDDVESVETNGRGWIQSPGFDLAFLILSPLAGFALAGVGVQYAVLFPAILYGGSYIIGVPHYLASFAFYFGDENRRYARRFWPLFYMAPIAICAAVVALHATGESLTVFAVIFVWNIYHVATQSSGILSLYRRLAGGRLEERPWAHRTILLANAAMALWYVERFPPLWNVLVAIDPAVPAIVRWACLIGAFACGAVYAREVLRRGFGLSATEAACFAFAVLLFTPYLWIADSNFATVAMLVGHFIQYLAIVWLLHRRKYVPLSGSPRQRWLGRLSESWALFALFIVASGALFYGMNKVTRLLEIAVVFTVIFNSLALTHFWLDGLIWAFRNPYIRATVGPYLTLEANRIR